MNNEAIILKDLLQKYKFTDEIPPVIKNNIYTNKKKTLKKILKQMDDYNFIYAIVITIYFLFRNYGIKISLLYCKILLIGIAFTLSGSTSYILYKHVIIDKQKHPEAVTTEIKKILATKKKPTYIETKQTILLFNDIECSDNNTHLTKEVTERLYNSLQKSVPANSIIRNIPALKHIVNEYKFIGRMHKIGEKYILTVKIIDSKDSSIKFSRLISFKEKENIDNTINELTQSIVKMDSLWK